MAKVGRGERTEAAHARDVALEATGDRVLVDEEAVTIGLAGDKVADLGKEQDQLGCSPGAATVCRTSCRSCVCWEEEP